MGSASSVASLPPEATAAEVKGAVGCLFDEDAWSRLRRRDQRRGSVVGKERVAAMGAELGVRDTAQITIMNLCQYVKCRRGLDSTWEKYLPADSSDAGLCGFASFDDKVWADWPKRECDPRFVQHQLGGGGEPVRDLEQLLAAAACAKEQFAAILSRILAEAGLPHQPYDSDAHTGNVLVAPLKGEDRIRAKADQLFTGTTPGSKFCVVHDVVRASYLCDSVADAAGLLRWLSATTTGAGVQLIRLQNRFARPTVTGYRDANTSLLLTLEDGTQHVCELQVHLRNLKTQSAELKSHETYEFFRCAFDGNNKAVDERLAVMLQLDRDDYTTCDDLAEDALRRGRALGLSTVHKVSELLVKLSELDACAKVRRWLVEETRPGPGEEPNGEHAQSLNNLAQLLQKQGKLDKAEEPQRQAIAIWKKVHGEEHPQVATGLNNLAQLLSAQGKLDEAVPLIKQSLAIDKKVYGEEHPSVAMGLNNLAWLLNKQGKLDEAEPLYKQAIAIWKKVHGEEHPQVAIGLNNLAELLKNQGKLDEAKPLIEQGLDINRKVHGNDHPSVATSLATLGWLLSAQGKLDEAEPPNRQALAIYKKVYGEDHPHVATTLNNLAELLRKQGKLDEAEPLYKQAIAIWKKVHGEEHPSVAGGLNNLVWLLNKQGKLDEAVPLCEQSLAIKRKVYGEEHPSIATGLNNLAQLLSAHGKLDEAMPLFKQSLAIKKKVYGEEHPDVAQSLNNLALLLWKQDNSSPEADRLGKQALAIAEKVLGAEHPRTKQYRRDWG